MKKRLFACILSIAMLIACITPVMAEKKIKNVIYMVPSGGGTELFYLAGNLKKAGGWDRSVYPGSVETEKGDMYIRQYMTASLTTDNASGSVTDSQAAATALATGFKTNNSLAGVDSSKNPKANLLEAAQLAGKKTGIVSTGSGNNAVLSAFSAHTASTAGTESAEQILNQGFDVVLTGGTGLTSWGGNEAEKRGYELIKSRAELENVKQGEKIWGDLSLEKFPYDIEKDESVPSISELTNAAIRALDNENGFFLVVEADRLGDACREHSIKKAVGEYLAFDEACREAIEFAKGRNDTAVVIAPECSTGGLTLPSDTSNATDLLKKGLEVQDATWNSNGNVTGDCALFIYVPEKELYPDGIQVDAIGTKRALTKNTLDNTAVAAYIAQLMDISLENASAKLFVDVTDRGSVSSENGMFKFDDGNGYSVRVKPNTSYAFFDDRPVSLAGEVALYINNRFYVPEKLLDIMSGKINGTNYDEVASPISADAEVYFNDGDISKLYTKITVKKLIPERALSGKIQFTYPESMSKKDPISFDIAAGASSCDIEIESRELENTDGGFLLKYEITTANGSTYRFESRADGFVYAGYADKPVKVDGVINEDVWKNAVEISLDSADQIMLISDWRGKDDLSGSVRLLWDEEYFYLSQKVTDDVFSQTNTDPASMWQGDSVQFGIFMGTEKIKAGNAGSNFEEIGLALLENGSEAYRYLSQGKTNNGKIKKNDSFEFECVRNGNESIYEMKISWRTLVGAGYTPQNGDTLGFSLLINDDDGAGRRGYMEYGSGIGGLKNASKFKIISLLGKSTAQDDEIKVICDGERISFDVNPVIEDGRVLVPVRAIFEKLGAEVDWNGSTKTVFSKMGEREVSLTIDRASVSVNGEERIIDVPARILNGRTLVPVRAVSEAYNCNVSWDAATKTVLIEK